LAPKTFARLSFWCLNARPVQVERLNKAALQAFTTVDSMQKLAGFFK